MRTQSRDTSEEVERFLIEGYRRFSPAERFAQVRSLSAGAVSMNRMGRQMLSAEQTHDYLNTLYHGFFREQLRTYPGTIDAIGYDLHPTLETVARCLHELPGVAILFGGLACSLYGFPRMVHDIDLLVDTHSPHYAQFSELVSSLFLAGPTADGVTSYLDLATLVKLDLIPDGEIVAEFSQAERLCLIEGCPEIPTIAPEDLLLAGLKWFARSGSTNDAQWKDLMGIAKIQHPNLCLEYLADRAGQRDLSSLLSRLYTDCDIGVSAYAAADDPN